MKEFAQKENKPAQNNRSAAKKTAAVTPANKHSPTTPSTATEPLWARSIQRRGAGTPVPPPGNNNTGLPNSLKNGIESLSGISMDSVRVHYNSPQPAQLNAHAYTQGSNIHVAPGQERHLPHEAWHVVQQAQGRVRPTIQMKGIGINDDATLEREADTMGAKAVGMIPEKRGEPLSPINLRSEVQQHKKSCSCPSCSTQLKAIPNPTMQRAITNNSKLIQRQNDKSCSCPSCSTQLKAMPNLNAPIQRAVANNGQPIQGKDNKVEDFLRLVDGSNQNSNISRTVFEDVIWVDGMGNRRTESNGVTRNATAAEAKSDITTAATPEDRNATAMSIAKVGNKLYVEGSGRFFRTAQGSLSSDQIEDVEHRGSGVHSEQQFEKLGHAASAVWCAIKNCYFCNGYLGAKGILHQGRKESNIFPEMWIHPDTNGEGWKIVKRMRNRHEPRPNARIWTISGHGGADGVYFREPDPDERNTPPTSGTGGTTTSYEIKTGTGSVTVTGPARTPSGDQEIDLSGTPAATAISGLSLTKMILRPEAQIRRGDSIEATVSINGEEENNPLVQELKTRRAAIRLKREANGTNEGTLSTQAGQQVSFHPPYLSDAVINRLSLENGAVSGTGTLTPSIPILNRRPMQLAFGPDRLRVFYGTTQRGMPQRGGMFRITECSLGVDLLPELRPSGELGFAMGPSGRDILTGHATVSADQNGLVFDGTLNAHIPGTDNATGEVHYRNRRWNGFVLVDSSKIRIPGFRRGEFRIDFSTNEQGQVSIVPSGRAELSVANQPVTLEARYQNNRFLFIGQGHFHIPGLREADINVQYDGTILSGSLNNIGFTWHGLNGQINVTVTSRSGEAISITGTGSLQIARNDLTGRIDVTLNNSGRFSGRGTVNYPFNIRGQRIEASAGIIIDEEQNVRVEGALRIPQPIELFRRFGDSRRLFYIQRHIPIPGLSIGPVGVVAVIEGGISVHYSFGPGQLRNIEVTAAFNPLAPNPDPTVAFHSELHIPANAGITGTIGGGLGVDAGLGSVDGTLTISGTLDLNAVAGGPLDLRYQDRRFSIDARPGIDADLGLGLSLDAHARARAGIGRFSVGIEKDWNLGRRQVQLGRFGMHVPIHWASNENFSAPGLDQIEWGPPPQVNMEQILQQLFSSASARETEH